MTEFVLNLSDRRADLATAGGKGASLSRLAGASLPVPDGFHLTTQAYHLFLAENQLQPAIESILSGADPADPATLEEASHAIREHFLQATIPASIAGAVAQAYARLPGQNPPVAVRSSATAEDLPDLSFAGQQETYLNIQGIDSVLEAVRKCWASLWTARAIGYRLRNRVSQEGISLAVVVQVLIPADAAGILFTADPISGSRDQIVITASWGLGEAIVGGLVTPDTLHVNKKKLLVQQRETAEKLVMTVRTNGSTTEKPVPASLQHAPVLSDAQAITLSRLGVQIEDLFHTPVDIEWTLLDGKFSVVQARPITALPQPETTHSPEWTLPDPKGQYMRTSIIDFMPDPLSPLFSSMALPAIRSGLLSLMRDLIPSKHNLYGYRIYAINGYAYMGASFTAGDWWWMLARLFPAMPRLIKGGRKHWLEVARPRYVDVARRWLVPLQGFSTTQLLQNCQEVLDEAMYHLATLMVATLGASAGSEMVFTNVYNKLIRREGDPEATTFLMGYNSTPIQAEKSLYDLAEWCREDPGLQNFLLSGSLEERVESVRTGAQPDSVNEAVWQEFCRRWQDHLDAYGHILYNLDFSRRIPADDPTPMLELIRMYLQGKGTNPHERQQKLETSRQQAVEKQFARLRGIRRWAFRLALNMGQSMAQVRENSIADIGLGYPAIRRILLEAGRRFTVAGAIAQPEDIFWLEYEEVKLLASAVDRDEAAADMQDRIRQRKATWGAQRKFTPPPMLPPSKKYMGFNIDIFLAEADNETGSQVLKGVGASQGCITAPARVLHGPEEFNLMQPGEVLVAAITTPAWTPLFAMASAVVTDIGGPLSHGSIVAREYGIPAVLGTGAATRCITNGQKISVDGSRGTVTLHPLED